MDNSTTKLGSEGVSLTRQYNTTTDYNFLYTSIVPNIVGIPAGNIPSNSIADTDFIDVTTIQGTKLQSRGGKTYFDLQNGKIVLNDGTYDRILLDAQGTPLKASKPGFDVNTTGNENLAFSSEFRPIPDDWNLFTQLQFSYTSATRISVSGGTPSTYFAKGDKIKITQTTDKYFSITDVGSNYIDITAGTSYTFANAAITAFYISRMDNPLGFPTEFTWSPTITGFGFTFGTGTFTARFSLKGNLVRVRFYSTGNSSNTGTGRVAIMNPPITAGSDYSFNYLVPAVAVANGTSVLGWAALQSTTALWATWTADISTGTNNSISFDFTYQI